jgi:hypothetical protein
MPKKISLKISLGHSWTRKLLGNVLTGKKVETIGKSLEQSPEKAMTHSTQDWQFQIISN